MAISLERGSRSSVLELEEQVAGRQDVPLLLLGSAFAGQSLHLQAINLIRNRDLHLHLHGFEDTQWISSLKHVTNFHVVCQHLSWNNARQLVNVARGGLSGSTVGCCSNGGIWVR